MKQSLFLFLMAMAVIAGPVTISFAQDSHDHETSHEHDQDGEHEDGHNDHNDHGEENDDHDAHGHDNHDSEDAHDDHGHGGEGHHDEGQTEIDDEHAAKAGVQVETAQSGVIADTLTLTGRIMLNRDTTAEVKARFPGIVRSVPVKLGQRVQKGDVLARIESNESLKDYNVVAPVSGVILKRNTNEGDVAGDEGLFTIADLSTVWAKFHIFAKDTAFVEEGQNVRVHTLDDAMQADAPIMLLLPTADALSQTHIAIVALDNPAGKWRPGVTVEGDVALSQRQAPIVIPQAALQNMEEQIVVFVKDGNAYEMRPVKTGKSDGKNIEILDGLKAGERYVSAGSFIIKADILKSGAAHEH